MVFKIKEIQSKFQDNNYILYRKKVAEQKQKEQEVNTNKDYWRDGTEKAIYCNAKLQTNILK